MRKSQFNKKPDFRKRLINYAVDGGALKRCASHTGSVYRSGNGNDGAREAVRLAWQSGLISSDVEMALKQLDDVVGAAPEKCSHPGCWAK